MRLIKTKKSFRKEFKRQLRYAIAAAVGFMIIYAWRDSILDATKKLVNNIQESTLGISGDLASALIITVIGVFIIILSSRLLKD